MRISMWISGFIVNNLNLVLDFQFIKVQVQTLEGEKLKTFEAFEDPQKIAKMIKY